MQNIQPSKIFNNKQPNYLIIYDKKFQKEPHLVLYFYTILQIKWKLSLAFHCLTDDKYSSLINNCTQMLVMYSPYIRSYMYAYQ